MLTKSEIEHLKANQHEITEELLTLLRQTDTGKEQALEILDTQQNEQRYYLDAFDKPISFNGSKGLKKVGTVMPLQPIHLKEIERCAMDFNYFRQNYIRIKTPKGVGFPEIRDYQQRLIDELLNDDMEEIVGLMGRQCCDGSTNVETCNGVMTLKEMYNLA